MTDLDSIKEMIHELSKEMNTRFDNVDYNIEKLKEQIDYGINTLTERMDFHNNELKNYADTITDKVINLNCETIERQDHNKVLSEDDDGN